MKKREEIWKKMKKWGRKNIKQNIDFSPKNIFFSKKECNLVQRFFNEEVTGKKFVFRTTIL